MPYFVMVVGALVLVVVVVGGGSSGGGGGGGGGWGGGCFGSVPVRGRFVSNVSVSSWMTDIQRLTKIVVMVTLLLLF